MDDPGTAAIRAMLRRRKDQTLHRRPPPPDQQRADIEALLASAPPDPTLSVERTVTAGMPGEWLTPPDAAADRVLLYLHGGGYSSGSAATHRDLAGRLARAAASRVWVPEYRLAPEHPFPAAVEDAVAAYHHLLQAGIPARRLVIGGDSAGGGLTLATLLVARDRGEELPAGACLLSPWTDLAGTGASMETLADADPWLHAQGIREDAAIYLAGADPRDPLASPLYADLDRLPPILIQVGADECLLDDSTRLADRVREAGGDVTLTVWPDMWHVFPLFAAQVPQARAAIDQMGAWIQAHTA